MSEAPENAERPLAEEDALPNDAAREDPRGAARADQDREEPRRPPRLRWPRAIALFGLTLVTTTWAEAEYVGGDVGTLAGWVAGLSFSLPLMAILVAHEGGHYVAAKLHRVETSPPYFIPVPAPLQIFGTMGAVIPMPERIPRRNALLDIGASGPIAGMVVALPVLVVGILRSPVEPLPAGGGYFLEGHSLLYELLLYLLKGPMAPGDDIMLGPMAFAGWAGLLLTMINLIPFGQLDGGHVVYALLGEVHTRISRVVLMAVPAIGVLTGLFFGLTSLREGAAEEVVWQDFAAGSPWFVWTLVLLLMRRLGADAHPPTDDRELSPLRRAIALGVAILFFLLFMPAWMRPR